MILEGNITRTNSAVKNNKKTKSLDLKVLTKSSKEYKATFWEQSKSEMPTIIKQIKKDLENIENKIMQTLEDAYSKNIKPETYTANYLILIDKLNTFVEICHSVEDGTRYLELENEQSAIETAIKKANIYRNKLPKTKEKACEYIQAKIYRIAIANFKVEEERFTKSINARFNKIVLQAAKDKINESDYQRMLDALKTEILAHENSYNKYFTQSVKIGFENSREIFDNLYSKLQHQKELLSTPYHTAKICYKLDISKRMIKELQEDLNDITKKIAQCASLRSDEALLLIESRIDKSALLNSLTYFANNFKRIVDITSEQNIVLEAELLECSIRSREISKELIRLSKLERTRNMLPVERKQKEKLTKKQKEIAIEKNNKQIEMAILLGDEYETELVRADRNSHLSNNKLIQANAKLLKLEKQLTNLKELRQTRTALYLNIKSEYIDTIKETATLNYIDENIIFSKTPLDQEILIISAEIEGLLAKQKAVISEFYRIYGLKSFTSLNSQETKSLAELQKKKETLAQEIQAKRLELTPLLGKKVEDDYIAQNKPSNKLEQKLIETEGQKLALDKELQGLEALKLTTTDYYLNKKLERIDIEYNATSLSFYLEHIDSIKSNTELSDLKLESEIQGHIRRAMRIETELERINGSSKTNSSKLQKHVKTLATIYEEDIKSIKKKEEQQELARKVVHLEERRLNVHCTAKLKSLV